jgi:hypothetical protein
MTNTAKHYKGALLSYNPQKNMTTLETPTRAKNALFNFSNVPGKWAYRTCSHLIKKNAPIYALKRAMDSALYFEAKGW